MGAAGVGAAVVGEESSLMGAALVDAWVDDARCWSCSWWTGLEDASGMAALQNFAMVFWGEKKRRRWMVKRRLNSVLLQCRTELEGRRKVGYG